MKVPEEGDHLTQSAQDSDSWLRGSRALCAWCLLGLQKRLVWPVHVLVATLQEVWGCCSFGAVQSHRVILSRRSQDGTFKDCLGLPTEEWVVRN